MPRLLATGEFNLERLWFGVMYYFAPVWVLHGADGQLLLEATRQKWIDAAELPPSSFLLTDPLIVIAGALLLARLVDVQSHRWAYPAGMALIVVHVAISQAEPAKHMFKRGGPEELCGLYHQARQVEKLPVCAMPAGAPRPSG